MNINIQKPETSRAFVFDVQVGVHRKTEPTVDPLSGMVLNLVNMDAVLTELRTFWAAQALRSLPELLEKSQEFLAARFQSENVSLGELVLLEKRGFFLKWYLGRKFSGHDEMHELDGSLFKTRSQYLLDENNWEQQRLQVSTVDQLLSSKIFELNPSLYSLEVENLATAEHVRLYPAK